MSELELAELLVKKTSVAKPMVDWYRARQWGSRTAERLGYSD